MIWGITGTRKGTGPYERAIREKVGSLIKPGDSVVTGCQHGVDTLVADAVWALYGPEVRQVLVVPGDRPHNGDLVSYFEDSSRLHDTAVEVLRLPHDSTYRDRNRVIVNRCEHLLAWPLLSEARDRRSGTWMTVRMARAALRPHDVFQLR